MGRQKPRSTRSTRNPDQAAALPASTGAAAAAAAAPLPSRAGLWIINSWPDFVLFVGTPLVIIPVVLAAKARFSLDQIGAFVAAFGAMGHHLPGMLRAYGDRALFQRFKVRFIVSPIFLLIFCSVLAQYNLRVLTTIVLFWGFWHALMQVFGIARIYDAKVGSFAPWTARLDLMMCICWFGAGLLFSPVRLPDVLESFYAAGGPLIPPAGVQGFRSLWGVTTGMVTGAFMVNALYCWRKGQPPNPIKLLLLVSSVGFWWYAMVSIRNAIIGVALFEIFHDVQYLSIVWVFNRRAVQRGGRVDFFTRALFQRSVLMVLIYVGLVLMYGGVTGIVWPGALSDWRVTNSLFGLLGASTLLHFYFDGFIWKVREKSTRAALGLEGGRTEDDPRVRLHRGLLHTLKWGVLVVPAASLGYLQRTNHVDTASLYRNLVAIAPEDAGSWHKLGLILQQDGASMEAVAPFRRAVALEPVNAEIHNNLGVALRSTDRLADAVTEFRKAIELDAGYAEAHYNLGIALMPLGETREAVEHFRKSLDVAPENSAVHYDLAVALQKDRNLDEAIEHYRHALKNQPDNVRAHVNLGAALASQGKIDQAIPHYRRATQLSRKDAGAHYNLGVALAMTNQIDEALAHLREAARLRPGWAAPRERIMSIAPKQVEADVVPAEQRP